MKRYMVVYQERKYSTYAPTPSEAVLRIARRFISQSKYLWVNGFSVTDSGTGLYQAYVTVRHGNGNTSIGNTLKVIEVAP